MTPLRQQMIEAMQQRGFSERTHEAYLYAVSELARYYRRSPSELGIEELQAFFKYLAVERGLSGSSCRVYLHGIRFLYLHVLHRDDFDLPIAIPKLQQRIPELLTRAEVARIIEAADNPKHRMLLTLCYGCGLRVSELVAVRVQHIDGERKLLRVEQGKGAKDRLILLAPGLLDALRQYWSRYRPGDWLFPSAHALDSPISDTTAQKVFLKAKRKSGITKEGGIHSLRHAYATHQLENGLPVHQLQRLLGHGNLQSTMRYIHWVPGMYGGAGGHADLIGALEVRHG
jgi:site-specific recombinase XerD